MLADKYMMTVSQQILTCLRISKFESHFIFTVFLLVAFLYQKNMFNKPISIVLVVFAK